MCKGEELGSWKLFMFDLNTCTCDNRCQNSEVVRAFVSYYKDWWIKSVCRIMCWLFPELEKWPGMMLTNYIIFWWTNEWRKVWTSAQYSLISLWLNWATITCVRVNIESILFIMFFFLINEIGGWRLKSRNLTVYRWIFITNLCVLFFTSLHELALSTWSPTTLTREKTLLLGKAAAWLSWLHLTPLAPEGFWWLCQRTTISWTTVIFFFW